MARDPLHRPQVEDHSPDLFFIQGTLVGRHGAAHRRTALGDRPVQVGVPRHRHPGEPRDIRRPRIQVPARRAVAPPRRTMTGRAVRPVQTLTAGEPLLCSRERVLHGAVFSRQAVSPHEAMANVHAARLPHPLPRVLAATITNRLAAMLPALPGRRRRLAMDRARDPHEAHERVTNTNRLHFFLPSSRTGLRLVPKPVATPCNECLVRSVLPPVQGPLQNAAQIP